jgi:hypothetical protein
MEQIRRLVVASAASLLSSSLCHAVTADPTKYAWSEQYAGTPLDLSGLELTFSDDFNNQSVTSERGKGPWFAPGHSSYGKATFDTPGPTVSNYIISNGVLKIRAYTNSQGKWRAGSVQTVNSAGQGFGQRLGYFEARLKFPAMPGAWCAFWFKTQHESTDTSLIKAEIDGIEWYGGDPLGHHHSLHLRPNKNTAGLGGITQHWWKSNYSRFQRFPGEWHTHGVLINSDLIIIYLDRKEVARFPALDEYKAPLYPLISMTLHEADLAKAVSPFDMEVDYVKVYKLRTIPKPPRIE